LAALNRQIRLAIRPAGVPRVADFHLVYSPLPSPGPGEVLVRSQYLSLDPHLRARMNADPAGGRSLAIGEMVPGAAVGLVVRSEDSELRPGDAVEGMLGWQEYAVAGRREVTRVDPGSAPLSTALGVLGLPGLTAYFGLLDVGQPQRGETVVVSGASGAIGMVAGQIARLEHCRVVGLASGEGDVSWLRDELGFDAAVGGPNPVDGNLAELCPEGVDVYFDTAGGATTDAVIGRLNPGARVCVPNPMSGRAGWTCWSPSRPGCRDSWSPPAATASPPGARSSLPGWSRGASDTARRSRWASRPRPRPSSR
jgi:hypothetical protein